MNDDAPYRSRKELRIELQRSTGVTVNVGRRLMTSPGATRAYVTRSRNSRPHVYHTDPGCPHFPESRVRATTAAFCYRSTHKAPCDYCVHTGVDVYVVRDGSGRFVELEDGEGRSMAFDPSLSREEFVGAVEPYLLGDKGSPEPDAGGLERVRMDDEDARRVAP